MFTKSKHHRGFTLIELLITLTIFAVVAIISVTALVNGLRASKKIQSQVSLYSEAQALMDIMARDIERNTVDYEAYYARNVLGETGWETANYGAYAMTFFDPREGGWITSPYVGVDDWYGANCSSGGTYPADCEEAEYNEYDMEMGTHPFPLIDDFSGYASDDPTTMNAFCEGSTRYGDTACADLENAFTEDLILVNSAGDHRIVYRWDFSDGSSTDYSIYRVALDGTDTDGDGLVDTWLCSSNYACTGTVPDEDDFVAISPLTVSIANFDVLVAPFEDPYRGFGEEEIQVQPQVTLVMRIDVSDAFSQGLLGEVPSITLQRTVSTGVYTKITSFE